MYVFLHVKVCHTILLIVWGFFWADFLCGSPKQSCVFFGLQQHQSICRIGRPSQNPELQLLQVISAFYCIQEYRRIKSSDKRQVPFSSYKVKLTFETCSLQYMSIK